MDSSGQQYHHGDLKRALIDAAWDLVRRRGSSALSLRAVAREAGVSHAAPYHHFADKAALVAAVAERGFRSLADDLEGTLTNVEEPSARLRASGVGYVVFAVGNPEIFRLMFGPEVADTTSHPELRAEAASARSIMEDAIAGSRREGKIGWPAEDAGAAAWSLVHGLAVLILDGQFGPEAQSPSAAGALARRVIDVMSAGMERSGQQPDRG